MSFISWFFSDPNYKAEVIHIPVQMDHALETISYIHKIDKEEVILNALEEYLLKNLNASNESGNITKFKRIKQLRG